MSLRIRRGNDTARTGITPAEGELIWTVDTKQLFVGDGTTAGGIGTATDASVVKVTGNQSIAGDKTFTNSTASTTTTTGALVVAGGVGIGGAIRVGGNVVVASGNGIDFSATANSSGTMTSELFADYEEGTFTPTMPSGVTSPTYSANNVGWYCKIGNIVHFTIRMQLTGGTAAASHVKLGGLPFTSSSATRRTGGAFVTYSAGFVAAKTDAAPHLYVDVNSTTVDLYENDGTTFLGTEAVNIQALAIISGFYPTF